MRSGLRALLLVLAAGAACKGNPQIGFEVVLPQDLADSAAWIEIGAFKDASCSALTPMLHDGVPDGAVVRVAFPPADKAARPSLGDIPRGSYAFGSVAKDDKCAVIAAGCASADVPSTSNVSVVLSGVDPPAGACGPGAACQAGRCVPANDNADPSVGAGCSLELLGAGPLANPSSGAGTLVSAPAIASTPSGFVIAYREVDPNGATAKITILPIDPAGGALPPARPSLGGRCGSTTETDGLGLAMNGTDGQIVVARPACADKAGLELLNFTSKPEVTPEASSHLVTSSAALVTLSPAHVAAYRAGGSVLAFLEDGVARVSTINPDGVSGPTGTFGALSNNTGAWVAASDTVLALLAAGPPDGAVPPDPDAGVDDGGASDGGTLPEGGTTDGPTLRLLMLPANTPLDQIAAPANPRAPVEIPGGWGAVATRGTRVIVLSEGTGPGRAVAYRTFDLDGIAPTETNGFSLEGTPKVTTGDVAIQGDRVFFTALKQGGVSLHAYEGASTTPRELHSVLFAKEPRIPAINLVRDGRVAVAVTDSRVAVVWTTATILNANDTTGGYAVFACTP